MGASLNTTFIFAFAVKLSVGVIIPAPLFLTAATHKSLNKSEQLHETAGAGVFPVSSLVRAPCGVCDAQQ